MGWVGSEMFGRKKIRLVGGRQVRQGGVGKKWSVENKEGGER